MTGSPLPLTAPASGDDSHVIDGVDVDAVSAAVSACPSVAGMMTAGLGAAASLLPGRRVAGVRVIDAELQVEVRARWGVTAAELADQVRAATSALLAGHRLHLVIADIDDPPTPTRADGTSDEAALPSAAARTIQSPPTQEELS